jgi:vacuolar protein sorting-associated protein 72
MNFFIILLLPPCKYTYLWYTYVLVYLWADLFFNVFSAEPQRRLDENEKCSRTFITFTDERNFRECFSQCKLKVPHKQFCPVTKLPAKYFDPITQTPYANLQAFKCIREAYAQQLAEDSNQRRKK